MTEVGCSLEISGNPFKKSRTFKPEIPLKNEKYQFGGEENFIDKKVFLIEEGKDFLTQIFFKNGKSFID